MLILATYPNEADEYTGGPTRRRLPGLFISQISLAIIFVSGIFVLVSVLWQVRVILDDPGRLCVVQHGWVYADGETLAHGKCGRRHDSSKSGQWIDRVGSRGHVNGVGMVLVCAVDDCSDRTVGHVRGIPSWLHLKFTNENRILSIHLVEKMSSLEEDDEEDYEDDDGLTDSRVGN